MVRVAWYRFRATFGRRVASLAAITLVTALLGGLALGAVIGARRTQSSFPTYLASHHAEDIGVITAMYNPPLGLTSPYDSTAIATVAGLPHIAQVADFTVVDPNLELPTGFHFHFEPGETPPTVGGSFDGLFTTTLDRVRVAQGRLANPRRVDEAVMSENAARELGMRLGSTVRVGFFTNRQLNLHGCCSLNGRGRVAPHLVVDLKLVGIAVFSQQIVEDDVDALGDSWVVLTPALMHHLVPCCAFVTESAIKVSGGTPQVHAVESEIAKALPKLAPLNRTTSRTTDQVVAAAERAIEPESVALAVFGVIAGIATLLIVGQVIARHLPRASK